MITLKDIVEKVLGICSGSDCYASTFKYIKWIDDHSYWSDNDPVIINGPKKRYETILKSCKSKITLMKKSPVNML